MLRDDGGDGKERRRDGNNNRAQKNIKKLIKLKIYVREKKSSPNIFLRRQQRESEKQASNTETAALQSSMCVDGERGEM